MSLSFKNPSKSSLQIIRRERKRKRELPLPVLWRCEKRPLFKVRCGCAFMTHLCAETRQESLIFVVTIGACSWGRHIHIHEFRIYSGKLWVCSSTVLHEKWNVWNSQTILITKSFRVFMLERIYLMLCLSRVHMLGKVEFLINYVE